MSPQKEEKKRKRWYQDDDDNKNKRGDDDEYDDRKKSSRCRRRRKTFFLLSHPTATRHFYANTCFALSSFDGLLGTRLDISWPLYDSAHHLITQLIDDVRVNVVVPSLGKVPFRSRFI